MSVRVCVRQQWFNPFPVGVSSWNFQDMFLVWPRLCTWNFFMIGSADNFWRPKKGVFGYFGTPPSVFELERSNFQNVFFNPWPKNCRKQIFDLGPPNFFRGGQKWSKFWTFLLFDLGTSNFGCIKIMGPWLHINWKILVWGPRLAPRGPERAKF